MTTDIAQISNQIDPKWIKNLAGDGLAPLDVCRLVVEKSKTVGEPIGNAKALEEGRRLIGCYPFQPHDPENYIAGIVSVLAEQPLRIAQKAIDRVTRKISKLPTRAELVVAIEEVFKERGRIISRAKFLLDEHGRRVEQKTADERRSMDRQQLQELLGAAHDDYMNIHWQRRYSGTAEEFLRGWNAAADKTAFCESWGQDVAAN